MKKVFVICILVFSIVVTACGSNSDSGRPQPDTSATANFPASGKFVENGKANHYMIFKDGHTYESYDGGFRVVSGEYKVEGNVYTELSADSNCGPLQSFTYSFDGTHLTFNYIDDPQKDLCSIRVPDFNNATYTLEK